MFQSLIDQNPQLKIKKDQALSKYTYTKTGGLADGVVFPQDQAQIQAISQWANKTNTPLTILGNGSNLIIKEGGIRGLVMIMSEYIGHEVRDNYLTITSGDLIANASKYACQYGLSGLEFACGIPGSVGGAIYMNAGAYGGEVKNVVAEVLTVDQSGQVKTYNKEECDFGYRHSVFMDKQETILQVTFDLTNDKVELIQERIDEYTTRRNKSQPLDLPSCGSVFKRPEGHYAGKLIQEAGLQGHRIGGVEVSTKHAGFMVNVDQGTASDYIALIEHVQNVVLAQTGVQLEAEVRIIGEDA